MIDSSDLSPVNLTKNIHLISVGGLAELPWSGHKAIAVIFQGLKIITIIPKTTHRWASHCCALLALLALVALGKASMKKKKRFLSGIARIT